MRMGEQGGTGTHMKKQQQLPNCIATMAHHQSEVHIHVYYCIYIYMYAYIYASFYIYICVHRVCMKSLHQMHPSCVST
jgi:hypothetical protein